VGAEAAGPAAPDLVARVRNPARASGGVLLPGAVVPVLPQGTVVPDGVDHALGAEECAEAVGPAAPDLVAGVRSPTGTAGGILLAGAVVLVPPQCTVGRDIEDRSTDGE
jgi:hypothetical protein